MDESSCKGFFADLSLRLPVRRTGTPRDLAEAALFALTNPYLTGEVVHVRGGGSFFLERYHLYSNSSCQPYARCLFRDGNISS